MTDPARSKSSARSRSGERNIPLEVRPGSENGDHQKVRIFDDLDLAAYVEELLSVKVDELATTLERVVADRLLDLVESSQDVAQRLRAIEERVKKPAVAESAPAAGPDPAMADRLSSMEETVRVLSDEAQRLREENARLQVAAGGGAGEEELRTANARVAALEAELAQLRDRGGDHDDAARLREQVRKLEDEAARWKDEAAKLKDESARARGEKEAARSKETSLQKDLEKLQAEAARLAAELKSLADEKAARERELAEQVQRLEETVGSLRAESIALREQAAAKTPADRDLERVRKEKEQLQATLREAQQRIKALEDQKRDLARVQDQDGANREKLEQQVRRAEEQARLLQAACEEAERQRKEAVSSTDGLRKDAEDAKRSADEAASKLASAEEERARLEEQVRVLNDPEKFTNLKLKELHHQIVRLEATMREKDVLLDEVGKDRVLLGQELEKERREKYENQVSYEKRLKEVQQQLARETREKEQERQERHMLEEQLAKYAKKKWPLW